MPGAVEFPDTEPRYFFDRDCLAFPCLVDGKKIECFATAEFLANFGALDASEEEIRKAFHAHKSEIQAIVRTHIANGWVDEDGHVLLTTRLTHLEIEYKEQLTDWPEGLAAARRLQRKLTELIGPYAKEVIVEWDSDSPLPTSSIICKIVDPTIPYTAKVSLEANEWKDTRLPLDIAFAWDSVLDARSRKLFLESGLGERSGWVE